jgi:hypothetical protein
MRLCRVAWLLIRSTMDNESAKLLSSEVEYGYDFSFKEANRHRQTDR